MWDVPLCREALAALKRKEGFGAKSATANAPASRAPLLIPSSAGIGGYGEDFLTHLASLTFEQLRLSLNQHGTLCGGTCHRRANRVVNESTEVA